MTGSPLVSADQLAAELAATTPPVVLDCRWQLAGGEQRVEDLPVGAVPADYEHAVGHGRGG